MSVGVETDFCRDEVFFRQFPIHRACRDGDLDALMSLLEQLSNQAHLTAEDSCYGWTPMHWAAHYGQLECVVHLVQMGCEVNTVTSRFNQTPTHTAAFGGHPHCVVWLTQAGADINKQDFVGEAPIHKAARSGSLECIQVLLIAGAEPHLRNASGQTAADLAHAHGFHDCFCFISDSQARLHHFNTNVPQNGDGAPCVQSLAGRKRPPPAREACHMKKSRRAETASAQQVQSRAGEEVESMNMDLSSADEDNKTVPGGLNRPSSSGLDGTDSVKNISPPSPPASSAEMCGSLHLSCSPSSSGSHQPDCSKLRVADCGDFLLYGHYHGFGDTAEDLGDSLNFQAEGSSRRPVTSTVHLYRGL